MLISCVYNKGLNGLFRQKKHFKGSSVFSNFFFGDFGVKIKIRKEGFIAF